MMLVIPFSGRLSDRLGRKPMWWVSLGGLFVMAIPMYLLMAQGFVAALVGFAVLGLLYVLQLSTISATFPAMFPTHVRFAGFAIAYNISTALFGGTAPAANEKLIAMTGSELVPAYYMMAACVVGAVALAVRPGDRPRLDPRHRRARRRHRGRSRCSRPRPRAPDPGAAPDAATARPAARVSRRARHARGGPGGGVPSRCDRRRRGQPAPAAAPARAHRTRGRRGRAPRHRGLRARRGDRLRARRRGGRRRGRHRRRLGPGLPLDVRRFGTTGARPSPGTPTLPLSLAVGRRLLDEAGWSGPTRMHAVARDASAADVDALAAELTRPGERAVLLVLGDGSTRRGEKAPGYLDERAFPYDDDARRRSRAGRRRTLLEHLDPGLADELMVLGRSAFAVLGAAVRREGATPRARLLHRDDPFGVTYLVALWQLA